MSESKRVPLVVGSPHDAVSAVPYLLGFHPQDSLVALGFGTTRETCALRLDLPAADDARLIMDVSARVAAMLRRNQFSYVVLIGYGLDAAVKSVVAAARLALIARGVAVLEALRVHDGRWWSYLCANPVCCPLSGNPFDISSSVIAAQATLAGHVALPDRGELVRTIAPVGGAARAGMNEATGRAESRFIELAGAAQEQQRLRELMLGEALPLFTELSDRDGPPTDDQVAWLGVLLTDLRVRDEAWIRIEGDDPHPHLRFWRDVVRRVDDPYVCAPACLLAYAAYIGGDGGLANVALDRVIEVDPDYTLADLIRQLIHAGIPPDRARLSMTSAELAAAYARDNLIPRHPDALEDP